jgi:hypothetical protein
LGMTITSIEPEQSGYQFYALNSRARFDKVLVTDFLKTAERIFDTAALAYGQTESSDFAIVIGQDGAIRILMGSDWPIASLQSHHGARAAYRVSHNGSEVRVEGKSRTGSCLLQSEPVSSVARRLLADPWHCQLRDPRFS